MADNYLERKMEEYRSASRRTLHMPKKSRAVLIADVFSPKGQEALHTLITAGDCHIAFCATDYTRGSRLAQATGSRFYCLTQRLSLSDAIADARRHYSPLNVDIVN